MTRWPGEDDYKSDGFSAGKNNLCKNCCRFPVYIALCIFTRAIFVAVGNTDTRRICKQFLLVLTDIFFVC